MEKALGHVQKVCNNCTMDAPTVDGLKEVHFPFLSTDRATIAKVRACAKKSFPKAKKITYHKPRFIVMDEPWESFWTHPEIIVTL